MSNPPLFAEPLDAGGWYIADADMRDVRGVIYISKRAAVRAIRAMSTATAAAALGILLMTAAPVYAGDRGGGPSWGTVVGAGILGGILGSATAPAPTPQQIIIVVPASPPAPRAAVWGLNPFCFRASAEPFEPVPRARSSASRYTYQTSSICRSCVRARPDRSLNRSKNTAFGSIRPPYRRNRRSTGSPRSMPIGTTSQPSPVIWTFSGSG